MNPNPTQIVLFSMQRHGVRCLLMGGQACVFYGAAEFSRDVDLAILAEPDNLSRLQAALDELKATLIEAHWFQNLSRPTPDRIRFWLSECRTPEILVEMADRFQGEANTLQSARPLLAAAMRQDFKAVELLLEQERQIEIAADRVYWTPLRQELERLRHSGSS